MHGSFTQSLVRTRTQDRDGAPEAVRAVACSATLSGRAPWTLRIACPVGHQGPWGAWLSSQACARGSQVITAGVLAATCTELGWSQALAEVVAVTPSCLGT